jgi:hypothetical protein
VDRAARLASIDSTLDFSRGRGRQKQRRGPTCTAGLSHSRARMGKRSSTSGGERVIPSIAHRPPEWQWRIGCAAMDARPGSQTGPMPATPNTEEQAWLMACLPKTQRPSPVRSTVPRARQKAEVTLTVSRCIVHIVHCAKLPSRHTRYCSVFHPRCWPRPLITSEIKEWCYEIPLFEPAFLVPSHPHTRQVLARIWSRQTPDVRLAKAAALHSSSTTSRG